MELLRRMIVFFVECIKKIQVLPDHRFFNLFAVIVIVSISACARLLYLDSLPFGFHNDEMMNGYVGKYILINGFDIYANKLPLLYFNNFGDYPNVIPMYISGLSMVLFGNTIFAVRFPVALAGVMTCILMYFVLVWLFRKRIYALFGALLLSVLPWHIVLSRATSEGILGSFAFFLGIFIIFISFDRKNIFLSVLGLFIVLVSYFLYPSFRILAPIASIAFPCIVSNRKMKVISFFMVGVLFGLTAYISLTPWGQGRFNQTSIFSRIHMTSTLVNGSMANQNDYPYFISRILHNKAIYIMYDFLNQYNGYFSPSFWFTVGGKPLRYTVQGIGVGYYFIALIIVMSLVIQYLYPLPNSAHKLLIDRNRLSYFKGFLYILLVSAIPAALTFDDVPNVHRTVQVGIFSIIIFTYSLIIINERLRKTGSRHLFITILLIVSLFEVIRFWNIFTTQNINSFLTSRNDEHRRLAQWLIDNRILYSRVFTSVERANPMYYLFLSNNYNKSFAGKFRAGLKIDSLDNIYFTEGDCPSSNKKYEKIILEKDVIVELNECVPFSQYRVIGHITYQNGDKAYQILQRISHLDEASDKEAL